MMRMSLRASSRVRCANHRRAFDGPHSGTYWRRVFLGSAFIGWLLTVQTMGAFAAAPTPPTQVSVSDRPDDAGTGLIVRWQPSADDVAGAANTVAGYRVWREIDGEREKTALATLPPGTSEFIDGGCKAKHKYRYAIEAFGAEPQTNAETVSTDASPVMNWIDTTRLSLAAIVAFICGAIIVCTELAKRGFSTYVRPLAGLSAIEEAVGRSTEMGRPMLYVPGIQDLDWPETVAGITILAQVGAKAAEYDTPLEVPTARSLVMTASREALAGAYLTAGRPESFEEDRVSYVTDDQFGYVASVCGWMSREKPGACFYLGKFYAESLLLAETGNSVGAIQLAGTAEPAQLPFFVAACDYTLLGEELFAASAYLSGEPQQLGTLKGQDVGKAFAAIVLIVGCLLATAAAVGGSESAAQRSLTFLKDTMLKKGGG